MIIIFPLLFFISLYVGFTFVNLSQSSKKIEFADIPFYLHIGLTLFTVIVFLFSFLLKFAVVSKYSLVIIPLACFLYVLQSRKKFSFKVPKSVDYLLISLVIVFGSIISILMFSHILSPDKYGNLMTGESTYGDLPFHLSIINLVSLGEIFPPENPFFGGLDLVYPYFINIFSSTLVTLGIDIRWAIIVPGIVLGINTIILMYLFFKKLFNNRFTAFLSVILFMLQAGLGFYYFFKNIILNTFPESFLINPRAHPDYSHVFGENIQWANYLSRIMVPERSVLLGIPLGLIVLYFLFLNRKDQGFSWQVCISAILTGLLPFSHTHTFLAFAVIIPITALSEVSKNNIRQWLYKWLLFGLIVLLVSAPQLYVIWEHAGSSNFFKVRLGWMSKPGLLEWLMFWWKNTGILIPLMLLVFVIKKTPRVFKYFLFSAFILFTLINVFQFQPYDWDNIKFLFWFGVFGAGAAGFVISTILSSKKNFLAIIIAILIILSLSLSGVLSIYREIFVRHQLFSSQEVELGHWVDNNTPRDSLFLTAPMHNSFVNNLAGRRIYMGYPGLLWVHGINYSSREEFLKKVYQGNATKAEITQRDIDYIVVSDYEKNNQKVNEKYFSNTFCLIKEEGHYKIYSVNCTILR